MIFKHFFRLTLKNKYFSHPFFYCFLSFLFLIGFKELKIQNFYFYYLQKIFCSFFFFFFSILGINFSKYSKRENLVQATEKVCIQRYKFEFNQLDRTDINLQQLLPIFISLLNLFSPMFLKHE